MALNATGEASASAQPTAASDAFPWKLWIYTNYDCNLRCTYCVAKSSPNAPRRAIGLANARQLVDEAVALGFEHIFFTGGEPFILPDIYAMLAHSSARVPTTVLTNAMLLRGARLEKLIAIANDNLIVQVSLDGGRAEDHDAYRGKGAWEKAVAGIRPTWVVCAPSARNSASRRRITSSARSRSAATRRRGSTSAWAISSPS